VNNSPAGKGNTDTRLATRLRELADRIRVLETSPYATVGEWRLEQDHTTGDLVAVHPGTNVRTVIAEKG